MPRLRNMEGREGRPTFFQEFFPKWVLVSSGMAFVLAGLGIGWSLLQVGKAAEGLGLLSLMVGSGIGAMAIAFMPDTRSYAPRDPLVWHGMADVEQPAMVEQQVAANLDPVLVETRAAFSASK